MMAILIGVGILLLAVALLMLLGTAPKAPPWNDEAGMRQLRSLLHDELSRPSTHPRRSDADRPQSPWPISKDR